MSTFTNILSGLEKYTITELEHLKLAIFGEQLRRRLIREKPKDLDININSVSVNIKSFDDSIEVATIVFTKGESKKEIKIEFSDYSTSTLAHAGTVEIQQRCLQINNELLTFNVSPEHETATWQAESLVQKVKESLKQFSTKISPSVILIWLSKSFLDGEYFSNNIIKQWAEKNLD